MHPLRLAVAAVRSVLGGSVDAIRYECRGCGESYGLEYFSCPDCGSYRVERTRWVVD